LPPSPAPTQLHLDKYDPAVTGVVAREQITLGPGFTVASGQTFSATVDPDAMVENVDLKNNYMHAYSYDQKYQLKEAQWGTHQLNATTGTGEFEGKESFELK
jgi:hypothetical protein